MAEKYIRKNRDSFTIVKNSKNYGKFTSIDDAIFIRNLLINNSWDLNLDDTYKMDDCYISLGVIDGKIHILDKSKNRPSPERVEKLYKKRLRNPNNSRYGLNITKIFDTFIIKKQIAGDDYIFGYYDNLSDAEFVRNHLLENDWNVMSFSQIHSDRENNSYCVIEVIDDKVYVLDRFKNSDEIDLDRCREEFLNRISKHKLGLAQYPHLEELTDKIPDLEKQFDIKTQDDVWDLKNTQNPLNDIIFSLTPFQKSVYDAVDSSTVEDIEKSLIRFKSGNFTRKIIKNLEDLEKQGLITKKGDIYTKI